MISVNRTWIERPVVEIITEVWDYISDDSDLEVSKYRPRMCDDSRWYITSENSQIAGAFWMRRVNCATWEAHANVRPKFWGAGKGTEHCRTALALMIEDTGADKVVSLIPDSCKPVQKMAEEIGFVREGVSVRSWKKNGELYDQVYYGITRT